MDATSKKLLSLLAPPHPLEIRVAALEVAAALDLKDSQAARAILDALDASEAPVRCAAIIAAGKLRLDQALPALLERVAAGGEESELAAQAAAKLGAKGIKGLKSLMSQVAPGLRRRIAAAMGAAGTATATEAAIEALQDSDPGVIDAAARTLGAEIPALSKAQRRQLGEHFIDLLKPKKNAPHLTAASETAIVRLLAGLGDPHAEKALWERTLAPHSPELRAAALQALGPLMHKASPEQQKRLAACAVDSDYRMAAPALLLLSSLSANSNTVPLWLTLLRAPDPAAKRAALKHIGDQDRPEVAEALVELLDQSDRNLAAEAIGSLARMKHGQKALAQHLLKAETPDQAWQLAKAQAAIAVKYGPDVRKRFFDQACKYFEIGDRRAEPIWHVLRAVDPMKVNEDIAAYALGLRQKKKYEPAQRFLRILARDPACGPKIRQELAGCLLKLSAKDVNAEARTTDACLDMFTSLIHNYRDETLEFVKKSRWLEPQDLFYLGFHFAEKERQEKEFGGEALRLVMSRSGRSKLAKDAKRKLAGEGMD